MFVDSVKVKDIMILWLVDRKLALHAKVREQKRKNRENIDRNQKESQMGLFFC